MDRNEAIEIVRMCCPKIANSKCDFETAMRVLVPELAENEDERIRKEIIRIVDIWTNSCPTVNGIPVAKLKSWLEKQGVDVSLFPKEQQKYMEKYISLDKVTLIKLLAERDRNAEEITKQSEKKTADKDKDEPKFKVGVWLVCCDYEPFQIIGVRSETYEMSNGDIRPFYMIDNNHNIRVWTIREAKDGDVLATQDSIFIFKHIDKTGRSLCKSYCEVIGNSGLGLGFEFSINGIYPANKEQRDLLFQKIKEAGYEWDADKKELKKIEQEQDVTLQINPSEYINDMGGNGCYLKNNIQTAIWSEEDERTLNSILNDLSQDVIPDEEDIQWLKALKERYTWKPSDEQMDALKNAAKHFGGCDPDDWDATLESLYNDLKNLM